MNYEKLNVDQSENENVLDRRLRGGLTSWDLHPESLCFNLKIQERSHSRSDFVKYAQRFLHNIGLLSRENTLPTLYSLGRAFLPIHPHILKRKRKSENHSLGTQDN